MDFGLGGRPLISFSELFGKSRGGLIDFLSNSCISMIDPLLETSLDIDIENFLSGVSKSNDLIDTVNSIYAFLSRHWANLYFLSICPLSLGSEIKTIPKTVI